MHQWRWVAAAGVGVVVLSVAMGLRERQRTAALERGAVAVLPAQTYAFRPVVVEAKRPTLSEILDLVLHERPTAAQLGKSVATGFPAGSDEAHVASVLARYTRDSSLVNRISSSLVKEGRRRHIGSSLLVGVLLTENPWLDPRATSSVGARGLMQVMPFHAGKWGCSSRDLFDVESNICHGVAILADNLSHSKSLPQALLGYNGCVRGTNTPDCWRYPGTVYRQARKGDSQGFRRGL